MTEQELKKVTITLHAKQRYAERIMNKESALEIAQFVNLHEEKIHDDICKMLEYGRKIYEGKPVNVNKQRKTSVWNNGSWILILDSETFNVVTLYKIDLGLDEPFTAQYVTKMLDKLEGEKERLQQAEEEGRQSLEAYMKLIEENEETIKEYNKLVRALTEQNQAYRDMINSMRVTYDVANQRVRETVGKLIGKKVF
nr:hypothetical protein [Eubacterium sp.]